MFPVVVSMLATIIESVRTPWRSMPAVASEQQDVDPRLSTPGVVESVLFFGIVLLLGPREDVLDEVASRVGVLAPTANGVATRKHSTIATRDRR